VFYNKTIDQLAPSYEQIFATRMAEEVEEILTQRSLSLQELQAGTPQQGGQDSQKAFQEEAA
jgi:hypothetical protein